ncbi:sugar-transfer associated ATP-grasp domain-containing protein [Acetanaerobacterium elongatum]|uniref:Sugar-transfer associated ATP-grasp n=1 Tax=Acetanaerobacterium elongatum TaxID=258515 RepID=A0A1G9UJC8_9FIRM|nr:sugar-transfer associated ATP-grasp domain-containing protein [Acetanaerobacterium elongatum]SDM60050.1 Sugar-transfer associated ATP-grasp [Acetanaerobacterium elongatum]
MHALKFTIKAILCMNYKQLFATAREVHKRTHKPVLFILIDIVYCGLKYGSGYMDYLVMELYNLSRAQRDTYMTRGRSNQLVRALNDRAYWHFFEDKTEFLTRFSAYLNRAWINLKTADEQAFEAFCEGRERMMVKPVDGDGGNGVERILLADYPDKKALYRKLIDNNQTLCEEYVVQHPALSAIYPDSVNTLRIVSVVREDGGVDITRCLVRFGSGGVVDNISSGGMAALIDSKTGQIIKPAYDENGSTHYVHPITGAPIVGVVIPMFDEVLQMVTRAAKEVPQVRYCAWDVAVCENGPVFIEGNQYPGAEIQQLPPHNENNTGIWPVYKKYLKI